jgi:hypothetical protein
MGSSLPVPHGSSQIPLWLLTRALVKVREGARMRKSRSLRKTQVKDKRLGRRDSAATTRDTERVTDRLGCDVEHSEVRLEGADAKHYLNLNTDAYGVSHIGHV